MRPSAALIFAKRPEPGRVKTRLVPPLTGAEAAELHRLSLAAVLELVRSHPDLAPILVLSPDEHHREVVPAPMGVDDVWPQGDGDLGARLDRASRRAFDLGYRRVFLLGADSPTLPDDVLTEAGEALASHDAAIGPCDDGGYYLLAMTRPCSELFRDIPWGRDGVHEATSDRARSAGLRLATLRRWYDLDRIDDLRRANLDLARTELALRPAAASLRRWLERTVDGHG